MKKNLPSDSLEEFLQNAFEAYTESPPDAVWQDISIQAKGINKAPLRALKSYPFWIGAVVAFLTGFIIYHAVQVNKELKNINRAVEKQDGKIEALQQQKTDSSEFLKVLPQATLDLQKTNRTEYHLNTSIITSNQKNDKKIATNAISRDQQNIINNSNHKKKLSNPNSAERFFENQNNKNAAISQNQAETIYMNSSIPTVGIPPLESTLPAVVNVNAGYSFELNKLANLRNELMIPDQKNPITIPPASALFIQPMKTKTKFYIGVQAIAMKNQSSVSSKTPVGLPPRDRRSFNQPKVVADNNLALAAQVGMQLSKNWSIETGVLNRSFQLTSTHKPIFKFKESKPPQHGGGPRDCEFEYDLNTPNGTVAVAITVEKTLASQPNADEEIQLEIATTQNLHYVGIPLAIRYETSPGKLHFFATGGVLTNFLLKNEFNITNINSNNTNFKPQNNKSLRNDPLYVSAISMDYLLQTGISYDLSSKCSVQLSPILIGSLSSLSANRLVESSNTAIGLGTAVTWSF